jgi:hypothetical protein
VSSTPVVEPEMYLARKSSRDFELIDSPQAFWSKLEKIAFAARTHVDDR